MDFATVIDAATGQDYTNSLCHLSPPESADYRYFTVTRLKKNPGMSRP
jgi:hypothetical protein